MTVLRNQGPEVRGHCPMGCGETLFLGSGGYVTCARVECPRPDAASGILEERETEHIVVSEEDSFSVAHPLKERLEDTLFDCPLHLYLRGLDAAPVGPGRYRVRDRGNSWEFTPLEG
jgi:hypothetical protein